MSISERNIKLLACSWAAPAWMKDSDKNTPDYISEKYNDVWARYHLKYAYDVNVVKPFKSLFALL